MTHYCPEDTETALRRLLAVAQDERDKARRELTEVTQDRDRWLRRVKILERRLHDVEKAIDPKRDYGG